MGVLQNSVNQIIGSVAIFSRLNPKTEEWLSQQKSKKEARTLDRAIADAEAQQEAIGRDLGISPSGEKIKKTYHTPTAEFINKDDPMFDWFSPLSLSEVEKIQQEGLGNTRAEIQIEQKRAQQARIKGWRERGRVNREMDIAERQAKRDMQRGGLI